MANRHLTLVSTWIRKLPFEIAYAKEASGEIPRETVYQTVLQTDIMDGNFLQAVPPIRRLVYRFLPSDVSQALEAFVIRRRYRVVITWTDIGALLFALLLKLTRSRTPHVAMMFWISKPKKALLLKHVHSHIDRIILWTSAHRDFAINRLGIPASKITYIPHYVDQEFWKPVKRPTDIICSAGREMRDYPTLLRALKGLSIPCHIATGEFRGVMEATVKAIYDQGSLPPNVTVGKLPPRELRDLYARSRFVVVPVLPTDSDNGLNVILEAMAMGRAVICSRTQGQRDVLEEGKTGIFVPVGDPDALRQAILDLWNNPELAERMGAEGRKFIERHHTMDLFVQRAKQVVDEVEAQYAG